jgi:hypothetical protein
MLFDYFKEKPNEKEVPVIQMPNFDKKKKMEYFATKSTGGPGKFIEF